MIRLLCRTSIPTTRGLTVARREAGTVIKRQQLHAGVRKDEAWAAYELLLRGEPVDARLATLKQMLVKRGNPFFLEESMRTLVEVKALAGDRGRYRLMSPSR
jgi:hypothetical protein